MKAWKIQKFASDVVYDLRSRNLLPVAILLVGGMLAVPLLMSRGGSEAPPPPSDLAAQTSSELAPETQSAVAAYEPGIREYRERLRGLTTKDPFRQQFTAPAAAAAASTLDQTTASGGSSTSGAGLDPTQIDPGVSGDTGSGDTGSSGGSTGDSGGGSGGGTGKVKVKTKTKYYSFQTDVMVNEVNQPPLRLNRIPQFTFLPSPQLPILVYLGTSSGGSQAIFLVSKDVTSVGGEGTCYPAPESCQLLGLNVGKGADLFHAPDGKTYHVSLARIKRVTSSKPPGG